MNAPEQLTQRWDDVHDDVVKWFIKTGVKKLEKGLEKRVTNYRLEQPVHPASASAKDAWTFRKNDQWTYDPLAYVDIYAEMEDNDGAKSLAVVECKGWRCDLGKTLRQVTRYQSLLRSEEYGVPLGVVVSPDTMWREEFTKEGLIFIACPPTALRWSKDQTSFATTEA